ncbi:lipid-A-disaccharide synthase-related protein [Synechocystis sp. PCC 7509]|uniref:lipid-A-disaccharide synthase-related protein n=1 Tax=Synechocystis sp. PCC 7509 TaxID=927677 RepID=UPI0002ACFCD9|nr:lipid-A-disaccharide synthase-related protein [Synechocystis sp. PCC 7509]
MSNKSEFRLLCLSNGHGEDIVAVRILQELSQISKKLNISALPLVGEGRAYFAADIPVIGSVQAMPSGGFLYMDGRQLVRDLQGGLLQLTYTQLKAMRTWVKDGGGKILAVGDVVPLLFAWWSSANYAFVGTAKSEYYVRDGLGNLRQNNRMANFLGLNSSIYLPWERWLMSNPRSLAVFPRDQMTAKMLQKWRIPVFDLGNPMMDGLIPVHPLQISALAQLSIVLLPGSRVPEVYTNWQQILVAIFSLLEVFSDRSLLFLGAISAQVNLEILAQMLVKAGFCSLNNQTFTYKNASIVLSQTAYNECLARADIAIAMAGTATEQFVGLGKPAIAFPGNGPQFTYSFAEAQSRHLGSSLILLEHPNQTGEAVQTLLTDTEQLAQIAENGYKRMGKPGAARRIAECLIEQFEQNN